MGTDNLYWIKEAMIYKNSLEAERKAHKRTRRQASFCIFSLLALLFATLL